MPVFDVTELTLFAFLSGAVMKFAKLALALAMAFSAVPAVGQIPTSTQDHIPSSSGPSRSEVALTDEVARDTVGCLIGREPGRTRNLLDTIPGTHEEERILESFASRLESCYDYNRNHARSLGVPNNVLRGFIAEDYYRRDFPAGLSPASAVAPELTAAWARPRPDDGQVPQMEMLHAMARCVTVRQPADVGVLLRSAPLSAEERAALRTLQPGLAACLDTGVEFTASRQSLRALLAEAAFHYAGSQRSGFDRVGRVASSE